MILLSILYKEIENDVLLFTEEWDCFTLWAKPDNVELSYTATNRWYVLQNIASLKKDFQSTQLCTSSLYSTLWFCLTKLRIYHHMFGSWKSISGIRRTFSHKSVQESTPSVENHYDGGREVNVYRYFWQWRLLNELIIPIFRLVAAEHCYMARFWRILVSRYFVL